MKLEIDFCFKTKKWPKNAIMKKKTKFNQLVLETLKTTGASTICDILSVNMLFVADRQIKKYNSQFRSKDCATNVLAFPAESFSKTDLRRFKMEKLYLGDIIFSFETIEKESKLQCKSFDDHLCHLLAHAFLHLLCYTHENAEDRAEMENLEILILRKIGIINPYELNL